MPVEDEAAAADFAYQPARPLNHITLADFKEHFESLGDDPSSESIDRLDPLIESYHNTIRSLREKDVFAKSLEELFNEHFLDDSNPPFALGQRVEKA